MIDKKGTMALALMERLSRPLSLRETTAQAVTSPMPYLEGPRVKVVLLTEGLGNIVDKNYYGPEAVHSMPAAFEGSSMFFDHPSRDEEKNIPERRVRCKVGYFKNLHVETIKGKLGCVGEVHFDLSDEGRNAYQKAKTAIHYREQEFPGQDREYVGISINAEASNYESRTMKIDGDEMKVNYVLGFKVPADSADMVTMPARGGAFLALVESIYGSRGSKEASMKKTLERLEAAQAALKAFESEKDADTQKAKVVEARQSVDSLLEDVRAAAKTVEAEMKKKEDESEAEFKARKAKAAKAKADADQDDADKEEADKKEEEAEKGKKESNRPMARLAAQTLIRESQLSEKYFDVDEMADMTVESMKKEIARVKRVHEAALETIGSVLPGHLAKESGLPAAEAGKTLNEAFAAPQ
jgi:hypothetical protein